MSNWLVNSATPGITAVNPDAALDGFLYGGNYGGNIGSTRMDATVNLTLKVIQREVNQEVFNASATPGLSGFSDFDLTTSFLSGLDDTAWVGRDRYGDTF